jgi:hypothetical protein
VRQPWINKGFDGYGQRRGEMRGIFDSEQGLSSRLAALRLTRRERPNMTDAQQHLVKLFQFPRMFGVPNISPFCCKLETWLRMTGIPYEVVDTPDPRKGPKAKVPFIVDGNQRLGDSTLIIEHLKKTRGVDPDAWLDERQRATSLLVQRVVEEHYAFITLYTHFIRDEGWHHTRAFLAPWRPR